MNAKPGSRSVWPSSHQEFRRIFGSMWIEAEQGDGGLWSCYVSLVLRGESRKFHSIEHEDPFKRKTALLQSILSQLHPSEYRPQ